MPASIQAIFQRANTSAKGASAVTISDALGCGYIYYTGCSANTAHYLYINRVSNTVATTQGFAVSDAAGNLLIPFKHNTTVVLNNSTTQHYFHRTVSYAASTYFSRTMANTYGPVAVLKNASGTTMAANGFGFGSDSGDSPLILENSNIGGWAITQDSAKNVKVQITDYQSTATAYAIDYANVDNQYTNSAALAVVTNSGVVTYSYFTSLDGSAGNNEVAPFSIWNVQMATSKGEVLATQEIGIPTLTEKPFTVFNASNVATNGTYHFTISRQTRFGSSTATASLMYGLFPTVLTAPAVTSGGVTASMFTWLDNSYWYLTDLQVNLGTRAVTHRHGTVEIKPNDTINFAVLFHNGSAGVDPVATDLRLAVRSASNASAYHFWSAATVTTAAVSGDTYYTITVTASDDDLMAAQAAGLLAGSNAAQSLLGEIQWTTTRGTFSSNTFTISVPNEVVRETDV